MVLNGYPGSQHEHKAEGFQPLSALLALRAGAGSQANADLAIVGMSSSNSTYGFFIVRDSIDNSAV